MYFSALPWLASECLTILVAQIMLQNRWARQVHKLIRQAPAKAAAVTVGQISSFLPYVRSVLQFITLHDHYSYLFPSFILTLSLLQMFGRFNQLVRHLSRPLPNYAHRSAAAISSTMTSSSNDLGKRMINTAGCIIIGDEVLGGKVY